MILDPDTTRKCLALAGAPPFPAPPLDCSEREFMAAVIALARSCGWVVAHFRPARTATGWRTPVAANGKGFVDLVLARYCLLYVELKTEKGTLSKDQKKWRDAILYAGGDWRLWRPRDWSDIERTLRGE
jgi:hypothetical protein